MKIKEGMEVTLKGISKKGKEKVNRDGQTHILIREGKVAFAPDMHILLQSSTNNSRRWVKKKNDPDFLIEEKTI